MSLLNPKHKEHEVVKNGTSCSSPDTQPYRVELGLVDQGREEYHGQMSKA